MRSFICTNWLVCIFQVWRYTHKILAHIVSTQRQEGKPHVCCTGIPGWYITSCIQVKRNLIKPYEDYLHTVNLKAEYIVPKNLEKDGDLYQITTEKNSLKAWLNYL